MDRNSKKFKDLEQRWYKKLKTSGFDDHENGPGKQDLPLVPKKSGALYFLRDKERYASGGFEVKQEYYRLAGHFLHEYSFDTDLDFEIWKLHAEGQSVRKTVIILAHKGIKTYKRQVDECIRRLVLEMKNLYVTKK